MPAPPSYDAPITPSPYNNYHHQQFTQRQVIYQRQAAANLNGFGPGSGIQTNTPIVGGRLKIYPREFAKSPPFQAPQQPAIILQQQQLPKPTNPTSPLLSAFTSASSAFNFLSTPPPPALLPTHHLGPTPPEQYPQNTGSISVPSSFPNSLSNGRSQAGAPGMASPSGAGSSGFSPGNRRLQHHVSYPSFAENMSQYASSPSPSYQSSHAGTTTTGNFMSAELGLAYTLDTLDDVDYGRDGSGSSRGTMPLVNGTDVICLGWESGVDIWKVGRGEVELLSRMCGLTGSVVGAKILPAPIRDDPDSQLRPLICLTIHSPILEPSVHNLQDNGDEVEPDGPYRPETAASNRSTESSPRSRASEFQTSVEIYSLSKRTHVATLFKSEPIPVGANGVAKPMSLRVEVSCISGQGNLVVVGVAGSGELFLFGSSRSAGPRRQATAENNGSEKWRCLTKLWTIVQPESKVSTGSNSGSETPQRASQESLHVRSGVPIFSLEGRWLAYSPPVPVSPQTAYYNAKANENLGGIVCVNSPKLLPSPPQQPQANTFVDVPEDEPMLNRVAREVTQEVIRGARWVGEQGLRAVKNYWSGYGSGISGTSPPGGGNGVRIGPGSGSGVSVLGMQLRELREQDLLDTPGSAGALGSRNGSHPNLPSQHGASTASSSTQIYSSNDPVVVSVLDLAKPPANARQELYMPALTFQPLSGLTFLSFSPGGLALLTASQKGDAIHVWDMLKGLHHPASSTASQNGKGGSSNKASNSTTVGSPEPSSGISINGRLANGHYAGRHVRQIARFTRITVAHIVDVSWSRPSGEKLSVLTDKGTVHFYDMPGSAYQWPPPKRVVLHQTTQGGVGGIVNSAVQASATLLANTQPLVVAARRRRRSSGSSLSTSVGQDSGLGASAGASAGAVAPTGQATGHRVSLPNASGNLSMGCVKHLGGKEKGYVAMMAGACLRIYESRGQSTAGSRRRSSVHNGGVLMNGWIEYELPSLPEGVASGVILPVPYQDDDEETAVEDNEEGPAVPFPGYWVGTHHNHKYRDQLTQYQNHPLSFAEIDTNNPFPPLHSERRITLSVFNNNIPLSASIWHYDAPVSHDSSWVFGRPIPAIKLEIGSARGEVEFKDGRDGEAVAEAMESVLKLDMNGMTPVRAMTPQPVKKGKKKRRQTAKGTTDDEGFFEDDCEVVDPKASK